MVHIREVPESNLFQDVDILISFAFPPDKCRNSELVSMRSSPLQLPSYFIIYSFHGSKARPGQSLFILNVSKSHSDTKHSAGLLRTNTTGRQNFFFFLGKLRVIRFDVDESKYGSQNALTPTTVREKGLKPKTAFFF